MTDSTSRPQGTRHGRFVKRIHIVGSVGSGKTTLARALSAALNIPFYELDNVQWARTTAGDVRRSDDERNEYLHQIVNLGAWIVEGVQHRWVMESFANADIIVFLDTAYRTRMWRIVKRFVRQKTGVEKANYRPTFSIFRNMFVWNAHFERESKPEVLCILQSRFANKLMVLRDNTAAETASLLRMLELEHRDSV